MKKFHVWVDIVNLDANDHEKQLSKSVQVNANNESEAKKKAIQQVLSTSPGYKVVSIKITH